jgi:Putative zinc-finger
MMHHQIEDEEIIERYVRNQLPEEERKAFEEHFFACDDCFEKLQTTERFVAGFRDAASRGLLVGNAQGSAAPWRLGSWLIPAFGATACAGLVLAAVSGWLYFLQMPKLRSQLNHSTTELGAEKQARAALEQRMANSNQAEANLPLVMLQATRNVQAGPNEVAVPRGAKHLVLWIDVPTGNSRSFRLQVDTADNRPVEQLDNLQRNTYGALAVSLPVESLQPGEYRIRLSRQEPLPVSLLGEYRLRIRRP